MKFKEQRIRTYENGHVEYRNEKNELHREDGPAVICNNGDILYYINGKLHREDGPAVIHSTGYKEYFKNGRLHREDGPAKIFPNGHKEYWIEDKHLSLLAFEVDRNPCNGKIVEIDGKKYKLTAV